jgi:hypothetical protein
MWHGNEAWACGMEMQQGHAAWTSGTDIEHGHEARTCNTNMQHLLEHVARTTSIGISMDMYVRHSRGLQHGHAV